MNTGIHSFKSTTCSCQLYTCIKQGKEVKLKTFLISKKNCSTSIKANIYKNRYIFIKVCFGLEYTCPSK